MATSMQKRNAVNPIFKRFLIPVVLFILAFVVLGIGVFINSNKTLLERADIALYNDSVLLSANPTEVLPATDERSSELAVVRAVSYLEAAVEETSDIDLKSDALYNMGTLMGQNALSSINGDTSYYGIGMAITKLTEAVELNPDNEAAKYNLEILLLIQAYILSDTSELGADAAAILLVGETTDESGGYSSATVVAGY